MKKLLVLFLLLTTAELFAQQSIEEYVEENSGLPAEKIFLHSDRNNYLPGDTLWFKGYLWYGYDQVPDTVSGVMYVDLINDKGRILQKRRLLIQNGTSNGEFCLDSNIIPGRYALRAYTRLMLNMNSGEPYYQPFTINPSNQNFRLECTPVLIKEIRNDSLRIGLRYFETDQNGNHNNTYSHEIIYSLKIGNQVTTDSISLENTKEHLLKYRLSGISSHDSIAEFDISIRDGKLSFEKQISIPLRENIDLQFFPEGGNLVNGLLSRVAFKAVGTDGLGKEVAGEIRTEDDLVVAGFKSRFKGMGSFLLKPMVNQQYFAHLWYKNQKYIVPFPKVLTQGSVMALSTAGLNNEQFLLLKQPSSSGATQKYVVGSAYGKIWFSAILKSFTDSAFFKIPSELLPEGVCRLTVLNALFEPECERLIYVNKNQRFKVEVIPDSTSYSTRSKVTLLIKTTNLEGKPVQTDLSLAVSDTEQQSKLAGHSISAYRLLESELKGNIEEPDCYFNNDSGINGSNLDLLLLTQGYRKFVSPDTDRSEIYFTPQNSFSIAGKLIFAGNKSQEKRVNFQDINLSLMSISKNPYVGLSKPDSLGYFNFQIPLMSGKPHLMIQATTFHNKPFNCDILLDKPVEMPKFKSLPASIFRIAETGVEYFRPSGSVTKNETVKIPVYNSMSKTLGEVKVTAKATAKNWWRNYDKDATKIADLDSLDPEGDRYRDLNTLLVEEFGARIYNNPDEGLNTVLLPSIRLSERGMVNWFPIYLIDGKVYWNGYDFDFSPLKTLSGFPVNEIKRILVIPPGKSIVMNYAYKPIIGYPQFILQSMVIIETYSKKTYRGDIEGVKKFIFDGLDVPRIFYSPKYEGLAKSKAEYDSRATLLWEPSVYTDSDGKARIDFFTNDRHSNLEVIVNGIETVNGNPGNGYVKIKVKSSW